MAIPSMKHSPIGLCSELAEIFLHMQFAMETWKAMDRKDIHMNRKCSMFIIRALSKCGYLKEMKGLGLEPSQHTFDGFVKAVIPERGVNYSIKVVTAEPLSWIWLKLCWIKSVRIKQSKFIPLMLYFLHVMP
ncbi:uncharacterized protein [Aristolochia californica]|uniref:uncharacterized protein isoform X2 n=1 Tax=Aristolochia californica TaxID=171875 RepID=UPI0035E2548E